jgi:thymidylate synthase ThyX
VIRKLLSHELVEVREIGENVKRVALDEIPTLVKYADAVPYLVETRKEICEVAGMESGIENWNSGDWCKLIDWDKEGEIKVLSAALFRFSEMSFTEAVQRVKSLRDAECAELADALLKRLGEHDIALRELEYATYTFELVMDQGAYAEFKRHRMMTQTPQKLTAQLGFATPRSIVDANFGSRYQAAMTTAAETYKKLHEFNPEVAQYIVPNGYHRRVLAQFNLREAYAFCQLRSARNAHFSIRRIAERMYEELKRVHPLLTNYMHLPEETWQDVEAKHFS